MKLDTDLVRQVLLKVEECPYDGRFHDVTIEGRTQEEITYHERRAAGEEVVLPQVDQQSGCPC